MELKFTTTSASVSSTASLPALRQDGGKAVPDGGNESPSELQKAGLEKIIRSIAAFLASSGRELNFRIDAGVGRTVSNPAANKVIRQIPSQKLLKISAMMRSKVFHTINLRTWWHRSCLLSREPLIDLSSEWI